MPIHFFRAPRLTATIASILLTAFAIAAHAQSSNATLSPIMYFYLSSPNGNVVADNDGNLYGATTAGAPTGAGSGLLYMLPKDGASSVKTIYQFGAPGTVADGGAFPGAGLLLIDNDTLYGVASATASDPQRPPPTGTGTIYKISTSGQNFTKLYEFEPLTIDSRHFLINNSGAGPRAPLIEGKEGGVSFLYGTAFQGGPDGTGTVFKFRTDGTGGLIVLGSFGAVPQHQRVDADGNPVLDSNGNPILDLDTNIDSQLVNPNGVNRDHRLLLGGDGYLYG
ncbi:MAG TPA: choice-of-anchor tandem repeat GloVer-containing protein, partial [Steroidobacteraceae bacterium]|nr:choice-of-anchor tandem repeat GloVer-containing protein [Steroidobacteraceae bacterium]